MNAELLFVRSSNPSDGMNASCLDLAVRPSFPPKVEHVTGYRERHAFSLGRKGSRAALNLMLFSNFDDVMRSEKRSLQRSSGLVVTISLKWFCLVSFDLVSFYLVFFWLVSFDLVSFWLVSFDLVSFWLVSFHLVLFRLVLFHKLQ